MPLLNIPVIWSSQVLLKLRSTLVFGAPSITNRNYQGEITQAGDRVKVTGMADPTIFDVTRNTDIPAPETLTDEQLEMIIDQSKGFNFQVDDLDQLQNARPGQAIVLQSAANAARRLAEVADASIAAKMVAGVASGNTLGTQGAPITIDQPEPGATAAAGSTSVYRFLTRLSVKLDKALVPQQGRWAVLPPFMAAALSLDPRFQAGEPSVVRNGYQGRVAGFDIYLTTALPVTTGVYRVLAGHSMATSYAEQLVETVFYRPERRFADAVKGVHVYGHKVFYPNAIALGLVSDASGLDA